MMRLSHGFRRDLAFFNVEEGLLVCPRPLGRISTLKERGVHSNPKGGGAHSDPSQEGGVHSNPNRMRVVDVKETEQMQKRICYFYFAQKLCASNSQNRLEKARLRRVAPQGLWGP